MSSPLKALFYLSLSLCFTACGVKGKPQPPLEQPVLGRGEMTQIKKTRPANEKKKYSPTPSQSDWDEKDDFIEDSQ